jgi:protein-disulfide isomerase
MALPYTIFSVYYQWRVAKQWCVLCLAVQALFVLGTINVLLNNFLWPLSNLSFLQIANCLFLFTLPALIWYSIKPFVLKLQENKNTQRQYLRIKFNTEIFEALLKKQKQVIVPTDGIGIDIGNPNATNEIIKVCNPYCGPCATAHPKIEALLEHNKNIKGKVIFTTPNNENNKAIKPVKHLLAIASENNAYKTNQALDDWYLPAEKDYETFANKHQMNGELEKQGNKIEAMDKWCIATHIKFTPTIFINGYQLPDAYSIEDLEYFLQE